jgi:hypothetical protein
VSAHAIERVDGSARCARPSARFTALHGGQCPSLAGYRVDGRLVCARHAKVFIACRGACRGHQWPEPLEVRPS